MSFSWLLTNLVALCLLPPLNGLLLTGSGCLLQRRWPRLGLSLIIAGMALLVVLSMQVVARGLLLPLERQYPPLALTTLEHPPVDAVVVPGGGHRSFAPEFGGGDDVTARTLERLRYGAWLAKTLRRPLLVSGGRPDGQARSEAEAMALVLRRDFSVDVRWLETDSHNTRENAGKSAVLLRKAGVQRIALVTHAWHMPRAVVAFERAGFAVVAAPTAYLTTDPLMTPLDFLPRARGMECSSLALHEWIGLAWYALRA